MARTLDVGDIVQATVVTQMGDQTALTVLHFLCGIVAGTSATDKDFATNLDAVLEADWKAAINNTATYRGIMAQVVNPPPMQRMQSEIGAAGVGTGGATPQPPQVSGIITWGTAMAGRAGRGRMYVPFPSTTFIDADGTPTASYIAALAALAVDIGGLAVVNRSGGGGSIAVQFVIYHRDFQTTDNVTSSVQQKKWATQKRRGEFGRPNAPPI